MAVRDTVQSSPAAYVRYVPERGDDIAWENDRMAFRVFGPQVHGKVGSAIDVWTKSLEYPIIDKWYRLNANGMDYHVDRGEGLEQLEGQIASAKISMARLSASQLYYVLSGNDFTLDINNPEERKLVCMGNNP